MAFARHLARQLKVMILNIRGFEFIVLLLRYIRWRLGGGVSQEERPRESHFR